MKPLFDCQQEIPCNPCETSCPVKGIVIGDDISGIPLYLEEVKCAGCCRCVALCPGLAIRLLEEDYTDCTSLLVIPYEFLPLPELESKVRVLGKTGIDLGEGTVKKIVKPIKGDPTSAVFIELKKEIASDVYMIKRKAP